MIFIFLLIFYIFSCFLAQDENSEKRKKIKILILILPMFILVAFRATSVGPDTASYARIFNVFNQYASVWDAISNSRMEPGFVALCYLINKAGLSYFFLQVVMSAFIYISLARLLYLYSENIAFSCFVFYSMNMMFGTMNVTRMWIAIFVLTYSIRYIEERKFFKFIIFILLAATFHYSALVFTVVYPLSQLKLTVKKTIVYFAACIIIVRYTIPFFTFLTNRIGLYQNYITADRFIMSDNIAVKLGLLLHVFLFSICLFLKYNKKLYQSRFPDTCIEATENPIEKISFIALIITLGIAIIGLSNNIMGRIEYYFSIFYLTAIPNSLNSEVVHGNRIILRALIILGLSLNFLVILILRPDWYMVIPYNFF